MGLNIYPRFICWIADLKGERIILRRFTLHLVALGQHAVCEELVGGEVEVEGESHGLLLGEGHRDVCQGLKYWLVRLLHHLGQHLHVLEDGQPEGRDSFHVFVFVCLVQLCLLFDLRKEHMLKMNRGKVTFKSANSI